MKCWTRRDKLYVFFGSFTLLYVYAILIYQIVVSTGKTCKTYFKYLTNWTFTLFLLNTTFGLTAHVLDHYIGVDPTIGTVTSFTGYVNRVVYLFVFLAYYVGTRNTEVTETFISVSKHGFFFILCLLFQLVDSQKHFSHIDKDGFKTFFITCLIWSSAPMLFLYLYGVWYLAFYFTHKKQFIYSFHTYKAVLVTGIITAPYCILTTLLFATIDIYIKQADYYMDWMDTC